MEQIVAKVLQSPKNLATEIELQEQAKVAITQFRENDIDGSETLSFQELKRLCDNMGLPMEQDEEEALAKIDKDGSNSLDLEEWLEWWLMRVSTLPNPLKQQEAIAINTFQKFDLDKSGFLDVSELSNLLSALGADLSESEINDAMAEIDEDGSGSIEATEFVSWWTQRASNNRRNCSILSLKLRKLANKAAQIFFTDIFTATWKGDIELVKSFIAGEKRLAQATDTSEHGGGWTVLHYACYQGSFNIIEELITAGANINTANDLGFTPLFYAAQRGHDDICNYLIDKNADPSLYGCDPSVDPSIALCPVDFIVDYPLLRTLFENHARCTLPKKIPTKLIEASILANSNLLLKFNLSPRDYQSTLSILPLRKWEIILSFPFKKESSSLNNKIEGNAEEDEDAYSDFEDAPSVSDEVTVTITVPAKIPSSDQLIEVSLNKDWLNQLIVAVQQTQDPVKVILKVCGVHCLGSGPFSEAVEVNLSLLPVPKTPPPIPVAAASETAGAKNNAPSPSTATPSKGGPPPPPPQPPQPAPPKRSDEPKLKERAAAKKAERTAKS